MLMIIEILVTDLLRYLEGKMETKKEIGKKYMTLNQRERGQHGGNGK